MRFLVLVALIAIGVPATTASAPDEPLLLGPICHAEASPLSIAGPHRLVMLAGMGNDQMAADTKSAEAQRWFDYALTLERSFEHRDAVLAFQRAEAADPACSLCVWGEAWASGPNINFGPAPSETPRLLALAKKAQLLAGPDAAWPIKPLEAALIDRYGADGGDLAYAHDLDAMQRAHPDDAEVAIFDAEAWLIMENIHSDPSGPTRAVQVLEPLLPAHPNSSGLIHFYVHATEDAGVPERAAPYAAKLAALAPSASHMVHMPSHTWYRLGRYEDAVQANVDALNADRTYATRTDFPTPLGGLTYHFHDIAFGLGAALMSGDRRSALELVRQFNRDFPSPASYDPQAEGAAAKTFIALGHLAPPRQVLGGPDTVAAKPFLEAMRHYARAEAYLRLGRVADVRAETALVALPVGASATPVQSVLIKIARLVLEGDADLLERHPDAAVTAFTQGAKLQETWLGKYDDPPSWWFPVRRSLAAALLAKGDAAGAEREAATVLQTWKLDPVTLAILARAERRLGSPAASRDEAAALKGWHGDPAALQAGATA
jgi:tetratricopeptide (TPR) repeat protein